LVSEFGENQFGWFRQIQHTRNFVDLCKLAGMAVIDRCPWWSYGRTLVSGRDNDRSGVMYGTESRDRVTMASDPFQPAAALFNDGVQVPPIDSHAELIQRPEPPDHLVVAGGLSPSSLVRSRGLSERYERGSARSLKEQVSLHKESYGAAVHWACDQIESALTNSQQGPAFTRQCT